MCVWRLKMRPNALHRGSAERLMDELAWAMVSLS